VLRFFGELGQYVYAVKGDRVYVNLFASGKATVMVGGKPVEIEQATGYPFDGHVTIKVRNGSDRAVSIGLRANAGMTTAGKVEAGSDGYGWISVRAGEGGGAEWEIPMKARRVYADPRVKASVGRVAVMRGPLVYAAEGSDNEGTVSGVVLPVGAEFKQRAGAGGVPVLVADGFKAGEAADEGRGLYGGGRAMKPAIITLRPYFMWANRGPAEMSVWLPETAQVLGPAPMSGVKASASFVGNGDGLAAIADRVLPESSGDESIPRMTFWPHKGSAEGQAKQEWVTYEFEQERDVAGVGVYWFDDTGQGECRVPARCTVEWRDAAGAWKSLGDVGVKKDEMNRATFGRVRAKALRLRVELAPNMSAGVLEWEVGEK
jgi:hypothetical protein